MHFITECKLYTQERQKLFAIFLQNDAFSHYKNKDKFIYMMKTKDKHQLLELSFYIQEAFKIRKEKFP